MNVLTRELTATLARLADLYREFYRVLVLEQGLIIANNSRDLHEIVVVKENIAQEIQESEEQRLGIMDRLADAMKRPRRELRVHDIALALPKAGAAPLLEARNELQAMVSRVKALNEINNQLLNDYLDFVHHAFDSVAGRKITRQGYGQSGTIKTAVSVSRNLVNTRA